MQSVLIIFALFNNAAALFTFFFLSLFILLAYRDMHIAKLWGMVIQL
jgi:hypothetical protein